MIAVALAIVGFVCTLAGVWLLLLTAGPIVATGGCLVLTGACATALGLLMRVEPKQGRR